MVPSGSEEPELVKVTDVPSVPEYGPLAFATGGWLGASVTVM